MVKVEMLTVGKELLIGRTVNTNAYWVGGRLASAGTMLDRVTTVDDDLGEIAASLREALRRRPEFLVVVGGLGPTPDDMTLKGVARGLGVRLKLNVKALLMVKEHYAKRGMADVELTPARRKMAVLPAGAEPVMNDIGTAPGVRLLAGGTTVYALPGVPAEMRGIFRRWVEPEILKRLGGMHRSYVRLKLEGVLESALAPAIASELLLHPGVYIKSHPRGIREGVSRIELDVAVVGKDAGAVEAEARAVEGEMTSAVSGAGGTVISRAEDSNARGET